jgi:hypothetical protein
MHPQFRRRFTAGIAALAAATALIGAGVLVGANFATAAPVIDRGATHRMVTVVTEANAASFSQTAWTDVAVQNIFPTTSRNVIVRFSAESICTGPASSWCSARILVGDVEAKPAVGTDFAFDSTGDDWESQSMERVQVAASGTRQVKVQVAMVGGATLRLDDWTLTIWELDIQF